ncbi:NAD(P)-binding protein [Canariomyces notabilis]|uniref:NAD(P)-binding protein n=1 Tax=Canariomyces notabilis TaxID=2074819 RepID=A0AAN6T8G5_9PEZI|nr:NAD(P)-binding protein [Canariomyces arenarius]
MSKIITIVGATGRQGQGVVSAFLNKPGYTVRAVTRNPFSPSAQSLSSQGATVVQADLNSLPSLERAFAGSHIIFAVTNFLEPFAQNLSPEKAMEVELEQGTNLAKAAAAVPTLEHYIWSTLPNVKAISAGTYLVPHFESKNQVDAYIRTELPALLSKTTFLWVGVYATNFAAPAFKPYHIPTADKYVQFGCWEPDTPVRVIADVSANIGLFVKAAIEQPAKTKNGGIVLAALQRTYTADEMLQAWAAAQGVKAQFVQISTKDYRELWPVWAEEMDGMMRYWDEYREKSWIEPSGQRVLGVEELGLRDEDFESLEEAYKRLNV